MKRFATALLLLVCTSSIVQAQHAEWVTDFETATERAQQENKLILMSFSGSDWCGNCIRLEKELFSQQAFADLSAERFVLLKLDFPAKKKNKLSPEQTAHNEGLAGKYNKSGAFPLVLVLNSDGTEVGQMQHPSASLDAYIANLKQLAQ